MIPNVLIAQLTPRFPLMDTDAKTAQLPKLLKLMVPAKIAQLVKLPKMEDPAMLLRLNAKPMKRD